MRLRGQLKPAFAIFTQLKSLGAVNANIMGAKVTT